MLSALLSRRCSGFARGLARLLTFTHCEKGKEEKLRNPESEEQHRERYVILRRSACNDKEVCGYGDQRGHEHREPDSRPLGTREQERNRESPREREKQRRANQPRIHHCLPVLIARTAKLICGGQYAQLLRQALAAV